MRRWYENPDRPMAPAMTTEALPADPKGRPAAAGDLLRAIHLQRQQRNQERHRRDHDRSQRRGDVTFPGGDQRKRDRQFNDRVGQQTPPVPAQLTQRTAASRETQQHPAAQNHPPP